MENEPFYTREALIELREKFWKQSQIEGLNEMWKLAYQNVATALDYCDAMLARCEDRTEEGE